MNELIKIIFNFLIYSRDLHRREKIQNKNKWLESIDMIRTIIYYYYIEISRTTNSYYAQMHFSSNNHKLVQATNHLFGIFSNMYLCIWSNAHETIYGRQICIWDIRPSFVCVLTWLLNWYQIECLLSTFGLYSMHFWTFFFTYVRWVSNVFFVSFFWFISLLFIKLFILFKCPLFIFSSPI